MRRSSCCVVVLAVLFACGGEGGPSQPTVASITLTAANPAPLASLGDTVQLTASALDSKGAPIPGIVIAFSTGNVAVASVTPAGLVTAVANGTATIHASAQGKEATHDVTVAQVATQVLVTPASIRVPPGETPLFHAAAVDARGNPVAGSPAPAWTTTDAALATIAADGRAAVSGAVASGTVRAVATVGQLTSQTGGVMTIDPAAVYVETILVSAPSGAFASLNQTAQLSASASNPRQGDVTSQVAFTWSSSAPTVASVSTSGLVTALGNGTAEISATSNGVSGAATARVAQVVATVSVGTASGGPAPSLASLGDTLQLAASALDAGGSPVAGAAFTWRTDAAPVASIDARGLLTATGNGTAHVIATATSNQVSNPAPGFAVAVQQVVASVAVTPATATISRCATQQYTAVQRDARGNAVANAPAPAWRSSSTATATVDANGLARGVAVGGPATITATSASASGTAQLTVNSSPIRVNWGTAVTTLNVTVCAGQSVVWHNVDTNLVHTASGVNGRPPNTGFIQPGADSTPQLFNAAGSYPFTCQAGDAHSGTVTVTP